MFESFRYDYQLLASVIDSFNEDAAILRGYKVCLFVALAIVHIQDHLKTKFCVK